jgi:hypothetical protein
LSFEPPPAKFFVNRGVVSNATDLYNLLRPLVKQAVTYRYLRGAELIAHGTGWVERIVIDRPDVSSYFTPVSICVNVDSFEFLEFETRPDQLIWYTLVQGDERVVLEYLPAGNAVDSDGVSQQAFDLVPDGYVQMELTGLEPSEPGGGESGLEPGGV